MKRVSGSEKLEWGNQLAEIRRGDGDRVQIAVLYLCCEGQDDLPIVANCEYGDGEGVYFIRLMEHQIKLTEALSPGQWMRWELAEPVALRAVELDHGKRPDKGRLSSDIGTTANKNSAVEEIWRKMAEAR